MRVSGPFLLSPLIALTIVLLSGCTGVPKAEMEAAECYLFPHFKTILKPEFAMTAAERAKAIQQSYKDAGTAFAGLILYELVVDEEGNVVKIRTVRSYYHDDEEQFFTRSFRRIVQGYKFRLDAVSSVYRTFYYPMLLDRKSEIRNWPGGPPL